MKSSSGLGSGCRIGHPLSIRLAADTVGTGQQRLSLVANLLNKRLFAEGFARVGGPPQDSGLELSLGFIHHLSPALEAARLAPEIQVGDPSRVLARNMGFRT